MKRWSSTMRSISSLSGGTGSSSFGNENEQLRASTVHQNSKRASKLFNGRFPFVHHSASGHFMCPTSVSWSPVDDMISMHIGTTPTDNTSTQTNMQAFRTSCCFSCWPHCGVRRGRQRGASGLRLAGLLQCSHGGTGCEQQGGRHRPSWTFEQCWCASFSFPCASARRTCSMPRSFSVDIASRSNHTG